MQAREGSGPGLFRYPELGVWACALRATYKNLIGFMRTITEN